MNEMRRNDVQPELLCLYQNIPLAFVPHSHDPKRNMSFLSLFSVKSCVYAVSMVQRNLFIKLRY